MRRYAFLCLLVALCAAWAAPLSAQGRFARHPFGPGVRPLDRILPFVRNARPGRFYDAEGPFPNAGGGYHYRLKWLTPEGRVIWLDTDARTGRVLGVERGDWREQIPPPTPYYNGVPGPYGPPPQGESYARPPGRGPDY
jgi:hypothetical protein